MQNRKLSFVVLLPLVLSACAAVNPGGNGRNSDTAMSLRGDDDVTCRTIVKTGTRFGTRVCKTNLAWEQAREDSRDAVDKIQQNSKMGGPRS
ncbi:MAG: hypothetical protein NWS96_04915 [Pseudomonadales bacterium]|nr:hypothetical protein [Pseudomonadales bacterium]